MDLSIGVVDLARFVHRSGDIDDRAEDATSAREGQKVQKAYQDLRKKQVESYETEVGVSAFIDYEGLSLTVSGRIDGVAIENELSGSRLIIEEIKTTRRQRLDVPTCDRSVHEAQVRLYAAMHEMRSEAQSICTQLTYIHPDSGAVSYSENEEKDSELAEFLDHSMKEYCIWITKVLERVAHRNSFATKQEFPFDEPNRNQLQLARWGFQSLRDSTNLLIEAPTGTGKTMATAFPAVKSFGEEDLDRVAFVTARTTGQQAAVDAFSKLSEQNKSLVQVTVSAKERVCFTPGAACRPEECEYAKGHYDRVREARDILLQKRKVHRLAIDNVARAIRVCPFELSLDVAEWADVVVCDYNYVFDPLIQLKRLHSAIFPRTGLLIDEAHRLTERVRDMLSCEFDLDLLKKAVDEAIDTPLERLLSRVYHALSAFFDKQNPSEGEAVVPSIDEGFVNAVKDLFKSEAPRIVNTTDLDAVSDTLFLLLRYRAIEDIREAEPSKFLWLLNRTRDSRVVRLRCLGADGWINEVVGRFHGSIRFSGTLSPGELFNEEHGLDGPVKYARLETDSRRLGVFVIPQIATFFNHRERTAPQLAALLRDISENATGSWLVAFPSFAYMKLVAAQFRDNETLLIQTSGMNLNERDEFVEQLTHGSKQLGFVVMGGVFTESIDIEQTALEGVVIVSPALPPKSHELEHIKALSANGYEIAYRRPAMTRVVQAAGRVMRGENDRGMVVLIDPRFTEPDFNRYFPSHWQPEVIAPTQLAERIREFQTS